MKKTFLSLILAAVAVTAVFAAGRKSGSTGGIAPEVKLRQAEQIIEHFYVDPVNSDSVVEEAIRAMLKTLDPHSSYSTPEETRELNEPLEGNFSGIGISFNMVNDTLYVISTIAGGPSEQVGLLAGDRIIAADDLLISGVNRPREAIMKMLRGPKGTRVKIDVVRSGLDHPLSFNITRDDIPIYSVDAAYMVDDTNGYVRVSRFAQDTPEELRRAIRDLRRKGMKNIIIDLETNGGGYLRSAFEMAELFLNKGDLIVFTDGERVNPIYYNAESNGDFKGRVVVMVNQYSASASEILAGAMQDNDRGVIVGRRSFGKGLVQQPFPFPDGSMIRLTTRRYYTPSGRCIQKPYDKGDDTAYDRDIVNRLRSGELASADSVHFDPSLQFRTLRNHRTVYGGGGIMPDCFVPLDTTVFTDYYRDLLSKNVFNSTVLTYIDHNRKDIESRYKNVDRFIADYTVPQSLMDEIVEKGKAEGVEYNAEQYALSRDYMMTIVKGLIARDIWDMAAYYRVVNSLNPVYLEAVRVINSPTEYNAILSGSK